MKIIVGYAGGGVGNKVLQLAKQEAKAHNASVEIIHTSDLESKTRGEMAKREEAEKDLQKVADDFKAEGISCNAVLKNGLTPGEVIVEEARNGGADMIVIGMRSKSRLGKFVFGSTVQYVILEAPCPVLVRSDN
ncbi:MAG: universal stress protein [Deltaproteobacteria bacterium]|nr:universal stress protein [Deltaproteobacteria bacterium]